MKFRGFKRKRDGAWLQTLITTENVRFGITPTRHADQVGKGFGLVAEDIDVVDADTDPRTGSLVFPNQTELVAKPLVDSILADVDAVTTLDAAVRTRLEARLTQRLSGG